MVEPDRTLLILIEIRTTLAVHSAEFKALNARLDSLSGELSEILRRLDEKLERA
jgi:hypothetical protein